MSLFIKSFIIGLLLGIILIYNFSKIVKYIPNINYEEFINKK